MSAPSAIPRRIMHDLVTLGDRDRLIVATLRWLLDDEAEHGLKGAFREQLCAFLESQQLSELAFAIQSGMIPITTEVVPRSASVDLMVMLGGEPRLTLVSASTALREPYAIGEYQAMEATPVALARLHEPTPGLTLPVWNWVPAVKAVAPNIVAGPLKDFISQHLFHDPRAPDAGSSVMDLQEAQAPAPTAPTPAPATPPPAAPPTPPPSLDGWGGGGGGLSDGWMDDGGGGGGGGGGLSDGWMDGGGGWGS